MTSDLQPHLEASKANNSLKSEDFEEIIYHISHDVRASIRALKTLPAWLREDLQVEGVVLSDSVQRTLAMLETQAARADMMLLDLRTYSRVGRQCDETSIVALKGAIEEAAGQVDVPPNFQLETDLKVHALKGARNELSLLFQVLISNAVKHHDRPNIGMRIQSSMESDAIHITVDDDGPGIEPQFRDRVFDLMSTLRPRDACEGSGLGLSIARKIVARLGGYIFVGEKKEGRGARFEIRLPTDMGMPMTTI